MNIKNSGFTLIELIVIMGILAILAATLIALLNPGEQIKKAKDATIQAATLEYRNSANRYAASFHAYPWDSVSDGGSDCLGGIYNPAGILAANIEACNNALINAGEMSPSINDKVDIRTGLYITEDSSSSPTKLMVCYKPSSRHNINDPMTKYTSSGQPTCTVGSGDCYWCSY